MGLGISLPSEEFSLVETIELARRAEEFGYSAVWTSERDGWDGMALAAALGLATTSVPIGLAVVSAFSRPPALIAMGATTCHQLSGGRFTLGLGASSRPITERWMGLQFEQPVARVRDVLRAVREILGGAGVSYSGTTLSVDGFRLAGAPPSAPPIHLAALGPAMATVAGAEAHGIILHMVPPDGVRTVLAPAELAASAAGRSCPTSVLTVPTVVGSDPAAARAALARLGVSYAQVPTYAAHLRRLGFEAEVDAIVAAWRGGDRSAAARCVSARLLEAMGVWGTAEECRAALDRFTAAGVDHVNVYLMATASTADERRRTIEEAMPRMVA